MSSRQKIKIPIHIFVFTIASIPGVAYGTILLFLFFCSDLLIRSFVVFTLNCIFHLFIYNLLLVVLIEAMYWKRNHQSDEEFEEQLKENYSSKIQGSRVS